tara:strand:- start:344 stop:634 length:291 start_codon:yes stop_codon:yes gene_type:complete
MTKEREYLEKQLGDSSKVEDFKQWFDINCHIDLEYYKEQVEIYEEFGTEVQHIGGYYFESVYICGGDWGVVEWYTLEEVLKYYKESSIPPRLEPVY